MGAIAPYDGPKSYDKPALLFVAKHLFKAKGGLLLLEALRSRPIASGPDLRLDHRRRRAQPRLRRRPARRHPARRICRGEAAAALSRESTLLVQPMLNDPWGQVYLEAMVSAHAGHGPQSQWSARAGRWWPARLPRRSRRSVRARRGHCQRRLRIPDGSNAWRLRPSAMSCSNYSWGRSGRTDRLFLLKRRVTREVGKHVRKSCAHHRHHRPGRRLSRRLPAGPRIHRPRHQAPFVAAQHRAHRLPLSRPRTTPLRACSCTTAT